MKKNVISVIYQDRLFNLTVLEDCHFGGAMLEVKICEYLPNRKFFKNHWLDTKRTWTSDHATIEDGAKHLLAVYLKEEKDRNEIRKKWADFENRG